VHGAQAGGFEFAFEAEVEVGGVDTDEYVGFECDESAAHVAADAQQFGQMRQHLHQAHHAEFLGRIPGFESSLDHARTADADEAGIGKSFAQRDDETGAEEVAGGFAGDQGEGAGRRRRDDRAHALFFTSKKISNRSP